MLIILLLIAITLFSNSAYKKKNKKKYSKKYNKKYTKKRTKYKSWYDNQSLDSKEWLWKHYK